ncbi:hypothetical protein [Glaciecola punicea]|uniref:hypothetical protein n=1 Tax=Glaciecola punicea TaxID=56804 RepID=UPI000691C58B|nr:hypothetical protein [Glaciecola punicea]
MIILWLECQVLTGSGSFDGINTSYSFTKEEFSSNGASFDDFSGNYASLLDDAQISFDSDGVINGLDTEGCLYGGQVSIPDSNTNIYSLSITVDNCDVFNGTFGGLATLVPLYVRLNRCPLMAWRATY